MRTLRARLTVWYLGIVATALALFAVLLYVWLARTLYAHHDHEMSDDAVRLVQSLAASAKPLDELTQLDAAGRVGPLLLVRDSRGETLFRSARLASSEPNIGEHTALQHAAMQGSTAAQFFTVRLEYGGLVRFVCLPLAHPAGTYLQLGRRLGDVDLLLRVVLIASLVLIPVVVLLTSYGGLFVARRALTPIAEIADTLQSIQATDLSRRVAARTQDAEISRLSAAANQLLDRLQRAFVSLQEFSADVSHQLQTPLTVMKGGIEVTLAKSRTPDEYRELLAELVVEVDALAETIRDLRDFSLTEAESSGQARERIRLGTVFEQAADLIAILAEERGVVFSAVVIQDVDVWGNRIRLRQLLLNLGENAVKFTPRGGQVRWELSADTNHGVITFTDTGPGIHASAIPRVFERRFRDGPEGRAGAGLGLALVKRVVDVHGGTIDITSAPEKGTTVTVKLPLAVTRPART